jgi:hypothetical protein
LGTFAPGAATVTHGALSLETEISYDWLGFVD